MRQLKVNKWKTETISGDNRWENRLTNQHSEDIQHSHNVILLVTDVVNRTHPKNR